MQDLADVQNFAVEYNVDYVAASQVRHAPVCGTRSKYGRILTDLKVVWRGPETCLADSGPLHNVRTRLFLV